MKNIEQQYTEYFNTNVLKFPSDTTFTDYVHSAIYLSIDPSHNENYESAIREIVILLNSVIDGNLHCITTRTTGLCSNIHAFVSRSNRRISMSILGALGSLFVKDCELFTQTDIDSYIANNPIPVIPIENNSESLWEGISLVYRTQYAKWLKHHLEILAMFPLLKLCDMQKTVFDNSFELSQNDNVTKIF